MPSQRCTSVPAGPGPTSGPCPWLRRRDSDPLLRIQRGVASMAIVITVAQQKAAPQDHARGNLAAALAPASRVALLDIDPQKSLTRWHAIRIARDVQAAALTFSDVSAGGSPRAGSAKRSHDVVLIDSPPQIDTDARLASVRRPRADTVQPAARRVAAEGTLALAAANAASRVVLNACRRVATGEAVKADLLTANCRCCVPQSATAPASPPPSPPARRNGGRARSSAAAELRALLDELREITNEPLVWLLALHILCAVLWVGGMFFAYIVLRRAWWCWSRRNGCCCTPRSSAASSWWCGT